MSQIKTTLHGLHYDFGRGPVPIATTSHMVTHDGQLASEFARDMVKSGWGKELTIDEIAATACDLVESLNDQFAKRRWRVKVPPVDAEMLERRYDIKRPEGAA